MVSERPASAYLGLIAVAFAAAMNLGWAAVAHAGPQTLREGLFGDRPAPGRQASPPVARYVSEDGDGWAEQEFGGARFGDLQQALSFFKQARLFERHESWR